MSNEQKYGNGCQSCGSSELERENGYNICTDCGHVNGNDIQLSDDPIHALISNNGQLFTNQLVINSVRNELVTTSKITAVQQMGIQMAETLAINYSFNSEMKNYLMNYYNKSLSHKNFFKQSLKNRRVLAAVCAYITLMNHNESIAIQYVCSSVDCNGYEFQQMFNQFVRTFPESKPEAKPIEELVPSFLTDLHINEQEVNLLQNRVIHIISIERECWLVEGRSPIHLMVAATYLAWKSIRPYNRAAIDFNEFCNSFKIPYKKTSISRVRELNDVFIKLAQFIPWVKMRKLRVHRNNVSLFIDDIIEYSNSLIFDLRKDVYQKDNNCDEEDTHWMKSFKRKVNSVRKKDSNECVDTNTPKKRAKEEENENLEDVDISDKEISRYLRSEEEIKIIKRCHKRVRRMEREEQI